MWETNQQQTVACEVILLLAQMGLSGSNTCGDLKSKDNVLLSFLQALKWFAGRTWGPEPDGL